MGNNTADNSIESFLKQIDMYGSKVEINFQKKNSFKTVFGGLLTLVIFFFFVLCVWFFGQELVLRKNPSVITSQRSVIQAKLILMGITNTKNQPFIDPTIFQLKAYQEKSVRYNDTKTGQEFKELNQTEKKLKLCDKNDIGISDLDSYFQQFDLPKFHCFSEQELYIEGDNGADEFSQIYVYLERCQNETSKYVCKTRDEIDEALKQTKLQIYMSDKTVDALNFHSPFTNKGINLYSLISPLYPKEFQIFFTNQYIESDVGILYQQNETIQSFIFTEQREISYYNDPKVLVRILLRIQKQKENLMQRRYNKLADVVALVGGFLKVLSTIGALVCYPFSKMYLNKAIIDEIFNFSYKDANQSPTQSSNTTIKQIKQNDKKQKNKIKQSKNEKSKQSQLIQNSIQNTVDTNLNVKEVDVSKQLNVQAEKTMKKNEQEQTIVNTLENTKYKHSILEITKDLFKVTKNTIKFNFSDIFSHLFLKKSNENSEKHVLIKKGIDEVENHLDILFILNKIQELDKLKSILLNLDQLKLFEFIPKPIISLNKKENDILIQEQQNKTQAINSLSQIKEKKEQNTLNQVKTDEEKAFDAFEGLQNIIKKEKRTKVDDKLMDLIDSKILNLITKKDEKVIQINSIAENINNFSIMNDNNQQRIEEQRKDSFINLKQTKQSYDQLNRTNPLNIQNQQSSKSITFLITQQEQHKLKTQVEESQVEKDLKSQLEDSELDSRSMYFPQHSESSINKQYVFSSNAFNLFKNPSQLTSNQQKIPWEDQERKS